jgi:hypothetical protein
MMKLVSFVLVLAALPSKSNASAPEILDIAGSSPAAPGDSIFLSAICQANIESRPFKMAGIGANYGNKAFNGVFSSGDRDGSIARITANQFNVLSPSELREAYDVLLFTWATSSSLNADWETRIKPYIDLGGHVFWEDNNNIRDLVPEVDGVSEEGSFGSSYVITEPDAPNEELTTDANGSFANHHLKLSTVDPS